MLRDSNLFELLTDDELQLLVSRATEMQVPAGTNLLTEGETCSHIFWLIAGTVNVLAQGETIAQVDSMQCFGELPCLSPGTACSTTVSAITPCRVLRIDRASFLEVLNTVPKLWQILFSQTSERLSSSNKPLSEESKRLRDLLKSTGLLKDLTDKELGFLATRTTESRTASGTNLLVQGQPASNAFWLISGSVHVIVNGEIISQVNTPQCFGEMSCLVRGSTCSATIMTIDECVILTIDQARFVEVLNAVPRMWETFFVQSSKRLMASNQRMSEVLAHVPQGFMKLDRSARITQEYSAKCLRYFHETNLSGKEFTQLLKMDDLHELESWMEIYEMLFTDSLVPFNDLTALLTSQHRVEEDGKATDFSFTYHPSVDARGQIIAIDIGIEDVTELRKLELANAAMQYEQNVLGRIYGDPETFLSMLELMGMAITDCQDLCDSSNAYEVASFGRQIEITMRSVHSLKGLAGVFGLDSTSRCCDEMAHQIRELEEQVTKYSANEVQPLLAGFVEDFNRSIEQLKHEAAKANALEKKIGATLLKRLKGVVFSQTDFAALKDHVKSGRSPQAIALIAAAEARDPLQLFNNWAVQVDLAARTLGKKARFELTGTGGAIDKDLFIELSSLLVHVMNNAVDHGIEPPDEREDKGKPREGVLKAHVLVENGLLSVEITDDGRGIDWVRLPELARNKPNVDQQAVSNYEQSGELWRILLLPGFTTSSLVTRYSGYGVGLDSINQMVLDKGGILNIYSVPDNGTTISIKIPSSANSEVAHVS